MTVRTKIILGFALILAIGFAYLYHWEVQDLEPQYRKSTEEPLIDTARVLAAVASETAREGQVDVALFERIFTLLRNQPFSAQVYDFIKSSVDIRVYMTDSNGRVTFDSLGRDVGQDYSGWLDVARTLKGEYGARTSRDDPEAQSSVMYVAAPIVAGGDIIGVLSVGKPTVNANAFVEQTRAHLLTGLMITLAALFLIGSLLARVLTRPIETLTAYANAVRDGRREKLPALGSGEIEVLGRAFEQMRDSLEGKNYIEQYIQTLTHEIKSPLSAIKGAAEILGENPPDSERQRFLHNIKSETNRIQGIVERLLLLSRVEARRELGDLEEVDIGDIFTELKESFAPILAKKNLSLNITCAPDVKLKGDRFLLRHAIANILQNAIEFSAPNGKVSIDCTGKNGALRLIVEDDGPGIPEYALSKVFDRFFSLPRPETGRKSSGLGLSLVREVVELHGGSTIIENRPAAGVRVTINF